MKCAKEEGKSKWSRSYRTQHALKQATLDPRQSKLTDYFQVLDKIERIVRENAKLSHLLKQQSLGPSNSVPSLDQLTPILKGIIRNAEKNVNRTATGRRHPYMIKQFATALFIYAGPLAYEFLQQNMPEALPSLRTVQHNVHKEYKPIEEGQFCFDGLVEHIHHYNATNIVAIAEDATRVVARVDYDNNTDRCVGFVLPLDGNGLPLVDSFQATSFNAMQMMFSTASIAKYAYVYMAQPLGSQVPPFCLACIGTDNKFTTEEVLLRWQHIQAECERRGICVVSYGGDGDSRLMKAMKVVMQETKENTTLQPLVPGSILPKPNIPNKWKEWYTMKASAIAYVQDAVHIAVKLKSRLLKPSVVLHMGSYTATGQHLQMLKKAFTKEEHGLREKDIDHKDKQNFEAIPKILQASHLLSNIPDAAGTAVYLDIIACVIECYIKKDVDVSTRIERIWYAVFFLRYWRQWLLLNKDTTLRDNFITNNAHQCVEFNAHAIIALTLNFRDHYKDTKLQPWLLGSQTCERIFRAARSMSSVFSTVINFSMLGLLRRLHRLQIQLTIQSGTSDIVFPRVEKLRTREGMSSPTECTTPLPTNAEIHEAVQRARVQAKLTLQRLGMDELLKKHSKWESPTMCDVVLEMDDEQDDEDVEVIEETLQAIVGEVCQEDGQQLDEEIRVMMENGLIDSEVERKLKKLSGAVSLGTSISDTSKEVTNKASPFVEVTNKQGKTFLLRKSTIVWLLQEGEHVSSDRLIRVRAKQPHSDGSTSVSTATLLYSHTVPYQDKTIHCSQICAFLPKNVVEVELGRVIQFSQKNKAGQFRDSYRGQSAAVDSDNVGVLCCWYTPSGVDTSDRATFTYSPIRAATYIPVTSYICTISPTCLECGTDRKTSLALPPTEKSTALTATTLKLRVEHLQLLRAFETRAQGVSQNFPKVAAANHEWRREPDTTTSTRPTRKTKPPVIDLDTVSSQQQQHQSPWAVIGQVMLYESEKDILEGQQWLNGTILSAVQWLLKQQFPQLLGLQDTVHQQRGTMVLPEGGVQILHVNDDHWITASRIGCSPADILVYDSGSAKVTSDIQVILTKVVRTTKATLSVKVANTIKQSGHNDCGLFAAAYCTSIAYSQDPAAMVYEQGAMWKHLLECLTNKSMKPFPITRERRACVGKTINIDVFCYCRGANDNNPMVQCEGCSEWFHLSCVAEDVHEKFRWYCRSCS